MLHVQIFKIKLNENLIVLLSQHRSRTPQFIATCETCWDSVCTLVPPPLSPPAPCDHVKEVIATKSSPMHPVDRAFNFTIKMSPLDSIWCLWLAVRRLFSA